MSALDAFKQLVNSVSLEDLINVVGAGVLAVWLLRTSLGRTSLVHSRPRRNSMSPLVVFAPFALWIAGPLLLMMPFMDSDGSLGGEADAMVSNVAYCASGALTIALILLLARGHFARGLKGFGLDLRTVFRDAGAAVVRLLAVWPVVFGAIIVTAEIGRLIRGQDFAIPRHEALEMMSEFPNVWVQVLVVATAVVIAPLLEEMLWRGLFQTMLRAYIGRPWPAIAITAVLFASAHSHSTHWPGLFVLAVGLGYAYEKSGSLFQSIFMHAMFNGLVVGATLIELMQAGSKPV